MMDRDKDGILGKEDLRATWDQVGKLVSDKELDDMLAEAPGPVNFTQLLSLFANRMAGGKYTYLLSKCRNFGRVVCGCVREFKSGAKYSSLICDRC